MYVLYKSTLPPNKSQGGEFMILRNPRGEKRGETMYYTGHLILMKRFNGEIAEYPSFEMTVWSERFKEVDKDEILNDLLARSFINFL